MEEEEEGVVMSQSQIERLYPDLPPCPIPAIRHNFAHFFAVDFFKERHDQYIYRHPNGLCVIGLAPTHIAFDEGRQISGVDFNVGNRSRVDLQASGRRKSNARILEPNSTLCKVTAGDESFIVRCCVRGVFLEVNERLVKEPALLNSHADSEGFIAILMPKPHDWKKAETTFLTFEEYNNRKGLTND